MSIMDNPLKQRKKHIWFILLGLSVVALALTFVPVPQGPPATSATIAPQESAPTQEPVPTEVAGPPGPPVHQEPAPTEDGRASECTEPEPVTAPSPVPIDESGVFLLEAARCTRELTLRDFERIYNFWSNRDFNPYQRYNEREEFFEPGQHAGESWAGLLKYYAEQRGATYPVLDPRGYETARVRAVYQDPAGALVWIFYDRGALEIPLKRIQDDVSEGTQHTDTGIMRWMLRWNGHCNCYRAVAYKSRVSLPLGE